MLWVTGRVGPKTDPRMETSGLGWAKQTWLEEAAQHLLVVVASTHIPSWAGLSTERLELRSLLTPCSALSRVASLCTETLPLLAVTFITENSLVAAVSAGGGRGVGATLAAGC